MNLESTVNPQMILKVQGSMVSTVYNCAAAGYTLKYFSFRNISLVEMILIIIIPSLKYWTATENKRFLENCLKSLEIQNSLGSSVSVPVVFHFWN